MNNNSKASYKTTLIVWGAMLFSIVLYIVIVEVLSLKDAEPSRTSQMETLKLVFWCLAASFMFVIPFLKKMILKTENGQSTLDPVYSPEKLQTFSLISFAIAESVCVYGVVLYVLTRSKLDFYILTVVSIAYFIWLFPKKSEWAESDQSL